jgi:hypothetical protein
MRCPRGDALCWEGHRLTKSQKTIIVARADSLTARTVSTAGQICFNNACGGRIVRRCVYCATVVPAFEWKVLSVLNSPSRTKSVEARHADQRPFKTPYIFEIDISSVVITGGRTPQCMVVYYQRSPGISNFLAHTQQHALVWHSPDHTS